MIWREAILLGLLGLLVGNSARAATLEVGPGKQYGKPSAAIAAARAGDTIDIAPGQYDDCAVIRQDNLTVEGSGPGVVLTDTICTGKAILITAGDNITIRNLTLQLARVPGGDGAGIYAAGGDLTVDRVHFLNNQDGILSATNSQASIRIIGSDFVHNGTCEKACGHGIDIGAIKSLRVEHSRFFDTQQGDNIKSGALLTEVIDCDIEDGPDGTSHDQIDIFRGGSLVVTGTKLEKGPKSENHLYAITIGENGAAQSTDKIVVRDNTFINDSGHPSTFVHNLTGTPAQLTNNKFTGEVRALEGDGSSS